MVETKEILKYVPTTCPYCGVGCGLNLVVRMENVSVLNPISGALSTKANSARRE